MHQWLRRNCAGYREDRATEDTLVIVTISALALALGVRPDEAQRFLAHDQWVWSRWGVWHVHELPAIRAWMTGTQHGRRAWHREVPGV